MPFVVPHLVVGNGEVEPTCAKASTPPRNRGNFTHEARQSDRPLILLIVGTSKCTVKS